MNSGSSVSNLQEKVLSSENRVNFKNGLESEKSFKNYRKRIGPRIEPCSTPNVIGKIFTLLTDMY